MKTTLVQPYLAFRGHCQEALEFYRTVLGAEIEMMMFYKDSPEPMPPGKLPPGFEEKVMHASFRIGGSTVMAADECEEDAGFGGFSLMLAPPTEAEADLAFTALADGGQVKMPMAKTFWSPRFGMVTDRFGLRWMIGVTACKE